MLVDVPKLRYAVAVLRCGSFSAAARECGVAQPTVSGGVADLEERLGARLFERTTRKLAVTPAGAKLLPMIEALVRAADELAIEAEALRRPTRKLLRIGFSPLLGGRRLELLFEPFRRKHPDVETIYKECMLADMEQRLEAGSIDVVCGAHFRQASKRGRRLLYREPLHWVPPTQARPLRVPVSLSQVARSELVLTADVCGLAPVTRELFRRARVTIEEYAGYALSYSTLEEWADLGIGGAVLPRSHVVKSPSVEILVDTRPAEITYEAVWRKDLAVAEHVQDFVRYLRDVVPGLARGVAGHPASPG
jgi:DNA-binding transcriptional LysR family regulator